LEIIMTIDSFFFEYAKRFYTNFLAYELRSDARTEQKDEHLFPCYHPSRKRFNFMCLRRYKLMLQGIWPPETAEGAAFHMYLSGPGSLARLEALPPQPRPGHITSAIWQFSFRFLPVFPVFWVSGNLETWKGNIY
jgi:hypothetical protein